MKSTNKLLKVIVRNLLKPENKLNFCLKNEECYIPIPGSEVWRKAQETYKILSAAGLQKGAVISVCLDNTPLFLNIYLASLIGKWVFAPIMTSLDEDEQKRRLDILSPAVLFVSNDDELDYSGTPVYFFDEYNVIPSDFSSIKLAKKHLVLPKGNFIHWTSNRDGGQSKGVIHVSQNLLSSLNSYESVLTGIHIKNQLAVEPWSHSFGHIFGLTSALYYGHNLFGSSYKCLQSESRVAKLLSCNIDIINASPQIFATLTNFDPGRLMIRNLKKGIVGGTAITEELCSAIMPFSQNLYSAYCVTEAAPCVCISRRGAIRPNLMGRPRGTKIRITKKAVLEFCNPSAHIAYLDENGVLKADDLWHSTGDIVSKKWKDYYYEGRYKSAFKLALGYWVIPEKVEEVLKSRLPGINPGIVCGEGASHWYCLVDEEPGELPGILPNRVEALFGGWITLRNEILDSFKDKNGNIIRTRVNSWFEINRKKIVHTIDSC
ncbi:MAG: class I adenylate-forming enzyme family protein [Verrucomicrobiota bacterium]|nr:class I adenylate-forming enzyme family protein [Verrucomicrobiota bacterium]